MLSRLKISKASTQETSSPGCVRVAADMVTFPWLIYWVSFELSWASSRFVLDLGKVFPKVSLPKMVGGMAHEESKLAIPSLKRKPTHLIYLLHSFYLLILIKIILHD